MFLRLSVQHRPFSPSGIRRGSSTSRESERERERERERAELSEWRREAALVDGKAVGELVDIAVERGWTEPQAALQSSSTPETLRNLV